MTPNSHTGAVIVPVLTAYEIGFKTIAYAIAIGADEVVFRADADLYPGVVVGDRGGPGGVGSYPVSGHDVAAAVWTRDQYPVTVLSLLAGDQVALGCIVIAIPVGAYIAVPALNVNTVPPVAQGGVAGWISTDKVSFNNGTVGSVSEVDTVL